MDTLSFVVITVYMKPDLAEVARVLQALVRQPLQVEHFNANIVDSDVSEARGLESFSGPVMRVAIIGRPNGERDVERAVKVLNRLVSVYKVVHTHT